MCGSYYLNNLYHTLNIGIATCVSQIFSKHVYCLPIIVNQQDCFSSTAASCHQITAKYTINTWEKCKIIEGALINIYRKIAKYYYIFNDECSYNIYKLQIRQTKISSCEITCIKYSSLSLEEDNGLTIKSRTYRCGRSVTGY